MGLPKSAEGLDGTLTIIDRATNVVQVGALVLIFTSRNSPAIVLGLIGGYVRTSKRWAQNRTETLCYMVVTGEQTNGEHTMYVVDTKTKELQFTRMRSHPNGHHDRSITQVTSNHT